MPSRKQVINNSVWTIQNANNAAFGSLCENNAVNKWMRMKIRIVWLSLRLSVRFYVQMCVCVCVHANTHTLHVLVCLWISVSESYVCTWPSWSDVNNRREVDFLWSGFEANRINRPQEASLRGCNVGWRSGGEGVDVAGPVVGHLSGNDGRHLEEVVNQERKSGNMFLCFDLALGTEYTYLL